MNAKIAMEKKLYEAPEDVYNITEFYWDDNEIQLRTRSMKLFKAGVGTQMYEDLSRIIEVITPDRIRAYNFISAGGTHFELVINFPKQVHEPFEHH